MYSYLTVLLFFCYCCENVIRRCHRAYVKPISFVSRYIVDSIAALLMVNSVLSFL